MNIQHLESLNDQVWQVARIRVRETIPDWVVRQADEMVMIDLPPRALLHRLERGAIYGREKAGRAAENFFRESTLAALRELALRQAAHEVERRMASGEGGGSLEEKAFVRLRRRQKLLVHVTADPQSAMLIRRAKRVSDFLDAECFAVAVQPSRGSAAIPESSREAVDKHLNFARNLHIETRILEDEDTARTLVDFARRNQVTQIFLARPPDRPWAPLLSRNLVQRIAALARDMQIVIVSERDPLRQ